MPCLGLLHLNSVYTLLGNFYFSRFLYALLEQILVLVILPHPPPSTLSCSLAPQFNLSCSISPSPFISLRYISIFLLS